MNEPNYCLWLVPVEVFDAGMCYPTAMRQSIPRHYFHAQSESQAVKYAVSFADGKGWHLLRHIHSPSNHPPE